MAASNADVLALTRELRIPVPWDRNVFIEKLGQMRGRAIRLVPTDTAALADSPCGIWLACDDEDLILHEVGTTDYHIDQIVGHEIGHILLGHGRSGGHGFEEAPDTGCAAKPCPTSIPKRSARYWVVATTPVIRSATQRCSLPCC